MALTEPNELRRTLAIAIIGIVIAGFALINIVWKAGLVYLALLIVSFLIIIFWPYIEKFSEHTFYGVQNLFKETFIGGAIGAVFMLSRRVVGISMAAPSIPMAGWMATNVGQSIITIGLAPIAEEIFFRCILLSLFVTVLGWKFITSNVIQAAAFSLYHTTAYAGEIALSAYLTMSGAFVAAFGWGLLAGWLAKRFGLWSSICGHAAVNAAITLAPFVIIGSV